MKRKTQPVVCYEWTVEVSQNQAHHDLAAQEQFIVSFVGRLYRNIDSPHATLSKIVSLHFTRIYIPERDKMGAYVRLRVFAKARDLDSIKAVIGKRLKKLRKQGKVFQVRRNVLNWKKTSKGYGGGKLATVFRDYLDANSRTVYQLLRKKRGRKRVDIEEHLWSWVHFFFNGTRGQGRCVVEFPAGTITHAFRNM